jgi:hypothetical protein
MTYKVINTSMDRTKTHLHRKSPKFIHEPVVGGKRLTMGTSCEITDAQYEQSKALLIEWQSYGMIEVKKLGEDKPKEVKQEKEFVLSASAAKKVDLKVDEPITTESAGASEVRLEETSSEVTPPKKGPGRPKKW